MGRKTRKATTTFPLLTVAILATACATNPATGERELSMIGEGQEIQMGQQADQQIVASIGLYDDQEVQAYVNRVGQSLAAVGERPDLPWTFRVLDDPTVNAFALPGGFVYVTRGIMSHLTSEAELAGILGHEIGHITAKHTVNQISKAQLTQLGMGLGMILVPELQNFGGLADVGMQLLFLKYGRDDENQADELGVRYMSRLEYDPRELADVMSMLERSSALQEGSGRVPEWLSTHPEPGNRMEHIAQLTQALDADLSTFVVRREAYVRHLDGMVFGMNPREGYFEDNVFYHPDLRFRLTFPRDWRTVNMKQAVQSVSPNQDAMVVLTLAEGSPSQAMNEFARQQGVEARGASQQSINGLPAVAAEFRAATEQGVLRGIVAFLSHDGNTYRLLGYGPEGAWSRNASAVQSSIGSFAPENRPEVLNVEPARIDLVPLDASLSFQRFNERYPSTVRAELVALINQVDVTGRLDAGTLAKRVVGGR